MRRGLLRKLGLGTRSMPYTQNLNFSLGLIDAIKNAINTAKYLPGTDRAIFFVQRTDKWEFGQQLNMVENGNSQRFSCGRVSFKNEADYRFKVC